MKVKVTIPYSISENQSPAAKFYNNYRYSHFDFPDNILDHYLSCYNASIERVDDVNEHDLIVFKSKEDKLMFMLRWA